MRKIFTLSFFSLALVAASFNSFAQTCTLSTTAPTGSPGVSNTFAAGAEGFTGDFSWVSANQNLQTPGGAGTRVLTTPIYFLASGQTSIIVVFDLDRIPNANVTGINVSATTNTNPNLVLCATTTGVGFNPAGGTYYLTIPTTGVLPTGVNFRLNIGFTYSGNATSALILDNFGITATAAAGTLPVKFSSFDGRSVNGNINLTWNVAAEENVSHYEVEKSTDNRNFTTIGNVTADSKDSYSFLDTKATTATSYYRVKAVDLDGKLTFSPIVTMKGGKSSITLRGFPMPVINDFTLQHPTATTESQISISSAEGREVKVLTPSKGSQQTVISLSALNAGVYVVRYTNGNGEVETLKIVKQ